MNPLWLLRFHGLMTGLWFLLIVPSVVWWRESVPWLVAMSCYANVAGHFAAWEAARGEVLAGES